MSKTRIVIESDGYGVYGAKEYDGNTCIGWASRRSTNREEVVQDIRDLELERRLANGKGRW